MDNNQIPQISQEISATQKSMSAREYSKYKQYQATYRRKHRARRALNHKKSYEKLRHRVFESLGLGCSFCGDKHERALTVDHIGGGGAYERSIGLIGWPFYRRIVADPDAKLKYRTLCMKCNYLKRFETDEQIKARYGAREICPNQPFLYNHSKHNIGKSQSII